MKNSFIAVVSSVALSCCAAAGTVIDTYPDWDGNVTNGWYKVAQSFTAPADNVLDNWKFALDPPGGQNTVTFEVYAWSNNSGPVGGALYSTQAAWPANGGDVLVHNINLALTTGNLYGVVVDLQGYDGPSVHFQYNQNSYQDGDASWFDGSSWQYLDSGWNTKFRGEFVPEPASLLSLGLVGLALMRRR